MITAWGKRRRVRLVCNGSEYFCPYRMVFGGRMTEVHLLVGMEDCMVLFALTASRKVCTWRSIAAVYHQKRLRASGL